MNHANLVSSSIPAADSRTNSITEKRQSSASASQRNASSDEKSTSSGVWKLSGNLLETEVFLRQQPASLLRLGPGEQINSTIQHGKDGVAGVSRGKLISFKRHGKFPI